MILSTITNHHLIKVFHIFLQCQCLLAIFIILPLAGNHLLTVIFPTGRKLDFHTVRNDLF